MSPLFKDWKSSTLIKSKYKPESTTSCTNVLTPGDDFTINGGRGSPIIALSMGGVCHDRLDGWNSENE